MIQTIDQKTVNMFYEIYHNVFTDHSEVKLCTRIETIKLIELANMLEPDAYHGNLRTGMMQIFNIVSLYDQLCVKLPDSIKDI